MGQNLSFKPSQLQVQQLPSRGQAPKHWQGKFIKEDWGIKEDFPPKIALLRRSPNDGGSAPRVWGQIFPLLAQPSRKFGGSPPKKPLWDPWKSGMGLGAKRGKGMRGKPRKKNKIRIKPSLEGKKMEKKQSLGFRPFP